MVYTLEFEIAGDPNASGHTGTASFNIIVNGVSTALGTKTTPVDSAAGFQWGLQTFDVSAIFDPAATSVEVRWNYSAGSDAVNIRNLRITDGTDEWLDQWGMEGNWNSSREWAVDGSGDPVYQDWYDINTSMANYDGTGQVHHVINLKPPATHYVQFDISPDKTTTGQRTRINAYLNGTYIGDMHSAVMTTGAYNWRSRKLDISGLWLGDGTDVFSWRYYTIPTVSPFGSAGLLRNVRIVDASLTFIEADQYYPRHHGVVEPAGIAGETGSTRNSAQADVCSYEMSAISSAAAGYVYHDIPGVRCPSRRPVVGFIGWR